jgi:PAT family beta-lactamase induction signal transducer AmpG
VTATSEETAPASSVSEAAPAGRLHWTDALSVYLRRRVIVVLLLGFSGGLPLALSGVTLGIWMAKAGVNLGTIGLFALVGTPYTAKFLWAPLVDAIDVPVLSRLFGRRRGWLVLTQIVLMAAIVFLGMCDPAVVPWLVALGALLVAAASATQDIVIDAFRVESLHKSEQAAGMASYVFGYRIGMLASGAGALFLVGAFDRWGLSTHAAWTVSYLVMAALVGAGIIASLIAAEPQKSEPVETAHARQKPVTRVIGTAVHAFTDFLQYRNVAVILAFVVLYKFTDALAGTMTGPFVTKPPPGGLGFSLEAYAAIIKGVGLAATLLGGFAGGFVARAFSLSESLWIGGLLQAVANLAFSWQAIVGADVSWLTFAVVVENFTSAIGTVIFVAYLSALCRNPLHTATQYALLTALAAVGRTYLSSPAGFLAHAAGWPIFFALCAAAAIPGLALLAVLQRVEHFAVLAERREGAAGKQQ